METNNKLKILVSINSWSWNNSKAQYLDTLIHTYKTDYSSYDVTIALSTNYDYASSYDVIKIPAIRNSITHCWNNKAFIRENYANYDYVIESDDDIKIPLAAFEYYRKYEGLPMDYIPGLVSAEIDSKGEIKLLPFTNLTKNFNARMTLDGVDYVLPNNLNSACFICDTQRYELAINKGLTDEPYSISGYAVPDAARVQIYTKFNKVLAVEDTIKGDSLVYHLPNKYVNHFQYRKLFPTLNQFPNF